MKINLINPPGRKTSSKDMGLPQLVSLGSYVKSQAKAQVEILDLDMEPPLWEGGEVNPADADLVGIACYSSYEYLETLALAEKIRSINPEAVIAVGGYHPSAVPQDFVYKGSPFNLVIRGEGEQGLLEAVKTMLKNEKLPKNPVIDSDPIEDLDVLPLLDWDLLHRYRQKMNNSAGQFQMYLSRGCPYHCAFCMEYCKGINRWRAYSPKRALEEVRNLSKFINFNRYVNFADPQFGLDPKWRKEFLNLLIESQISAFKYWTLTRVEHLSEEDIKLFAKANFGLGFGLESGAPEMLQYMNKCKDPVHYLEQIEKFKKYADKYQLNWGANILIGYPGETKETITKTLNFLWKFFLEPFAVSGWLSVDPFRIYPGSRVYNNLSIYQETLGAVFHSPQWWRSENFQDRSFLSEFIDPSRSLTYEERIAFSYEPFHTILKEIKESFVTADLKCRASFLSGIDEQISFHRPQFAKYLQDMAYYSRCSINENKFRQGSSETHKMVNNLILKGKLKSDHIIDAFTKVDRKLFVPKKEQNSAYDEIAIGIPGNGFQTISAPHAYAIAFESLALKPGDKYLDMGAGSGYGLALAVEITQNLQSVFGVEINPDTFAFAKTNLEAAGYDNVNLILGDGHQGCKDEKDFDAVWISSCSPEIPYNIAELLKEGGRLLLAVGVQGEGQDLILVTKQKDRFEQKFIDRVLYVPVLR